LADSEVLIYGAGTAGMVAACNFARVLTFKCETWKKIRERVDLLEEIARILGPERSVALLVEGIRHGRKNSAIPGLSPFSCN